MKDLPHHMNKLNRKVIRSIHRAEAEEVDYEAKLPSPPSIAPSKEARRKHEKQARKAEREKRAPTHPSEDERNHQMSKRVPIFDRNTARPKHAKPTRKKTPPL